MPAIKDLHTPCSQANIEFAAYEAMGNTVQVVVDCNVIVYVHSRLLPFSEHVTCLGKRLESRAYLSARTETCAFHPSSERVCYSAHPAFADSTVQLV